VIKEDEIFTKVLKEANEIAHNIWKESASKDESEEDSTSGEASASKP